MADGSVIIKADVDDKQAQTELNRLTKKIDALNEKISDKKQEQMPLVEQSKQLGAILDDAKAKLDYMKSGDAFFTSSSIKDQERTVASLQKEWDGVQKKVETMDASIAKDTRSLERMSNRAGELSAQLAGAKRHTQGMSPAAQEAAKQMDKFTNRIKGLARRVFVFTLITKALRALKDYMWSAIQTNEKAMKAVSKLKGGYDWFIHPRINCHGTQVVTYDNSLLYPIISNNHFNSEPEQWHCSQCKTFDWLNGSYIEYVKEEDFLLNPSMYVENAYTKSQKVIAYSVLGRIDVYYPHRNLISMRVVLYILLQKENHPSSWIEILCATA